MIRALFFDFDGVIMDSMEQKCDSYCYALECYAFSRDDVNALQHKFAGLPRTKVLPLIVHELTGEMISGQAVHEMLIRFAEHDEAARPLMRPIPGSLSFLQKIHAQYYTAIVTGTPQAVIEKTVRHHHLTPYFDDVYGGPQSKVEIVESLLAKHQLSRDESLFIGDGETDQDAAEVCGIPFVGFSGDYSSFSPQTASLVVHSLLELTPYITHADAEGK